MADRLSEPAARSGKVRCPRCGSANYATDAVCLSCGVDLDPEGSAMALRHGGENSEVESEPSDQGTPLARRRYRQAPVLLLVAAVWLLLCITVYDTMGASGSWYEIHGLVLVTAVALCAVVGWVTEAFDGFEGLWAISPCRSNLAWRSLLALTLVLFGIPFLFAVSDLRNVHALAVEGRRELVLARVTGLRIYRDTKSSGATHRLDLEFNIRGHALRGREWVPGPTFPRAPEEAEYIQDQLGKPYRLFITYVPSNPAIYSFNPVDRASLVRAEISWGVALLFLATGLGLLYYYSRPS